MKRNHCNLLLVGLLFVVISADCTGIRQLGSAGEIKHEQKQSPCPFSTPYRSWFCQPIPGTVVGYPREGVSAEQDARMRIRGYTKMFVKGKLMYYRDKTSNDKQDSIRFYYDSSDTHSTASFHLADSFFVCCNRYICLMSNETTIDTVNSSGCMTDGVISPDPEYLYAEGSSRLRFYDQATSWMIAEESAIKKLTRQSSFHFAALSKSFQGEHVDDAVNVVCYDVDLVVKNVRIVARYYDPETQACTVWAKCRKTDIYPWTERTP